MMKWHLSHRPGNYAIWAIHVGNSRNVIGMVSYHRHNPRERRVRGGPCPAAPRWSVTDKWHSVMLYGLIAGEEQ